MAREYAQLRIDIWGDDDFRKLDGDAVLLYLMLLSSPSLSYCGVADWRPGRIAVLVNNWTADTVHRAAAQLVRGRYIVIDHDTEEVLVRSFVKHDGLMKNPKTAVSMTIAFAGTASSVLRGVTVHELLKLRRNQPELKGWGAQKVQDVLSRNAIDPVDLPVDYPLGLGVGLPQGLRVDQPEGLPVDQPMDFAEAQPVGLPQGSLPTPAPIPTPAPLWGYVTGEPHQSAPAGNDDPPPPHCSNHPGGTPAPCGACAGARKRWVAWNLERDQRAADESAERIERERRVTRQAAADRAAAIGNCNLCDSHGYAGMTLCAHDPGEADRAKRGRALVDAVLSKPKSVAS